MKRSIPKVYKRVADVLTSWPAMLSRSVSMHRTLIVLPLMALLIASCGMFSPRPAEHPASGSSSNPDPLNFGQLTARTEYSFTKFQYEDLLHGQDPIYLDNNSGPSTTGLLIQRLRQIYTADSTVEVTWSGMIPTPTSSPDTIIIPEARYHIVYHYSDVTGMVTVNDSGSSIFTIAHDANWHICYWKDFPGRTGASFFSPNFSH